MDNTQDGPKLLSENSDKALTEKVKYIPQSYLEKLCTETDENKFTEELKNVIYSHVDESEKLGKYSLDELVDYKSEEINNRILQLKHKLSEINKVIGELEKKNTLEYSNKIKSALKVKQEELNAHKKNKPVKIKEPQKDDSIKQKQKKINMQLAELKVQLKELDIDILNNKDSKVKLALKLAKLQKFEQSLINFKEQFIKLEKQYKTDMANYDIKFDKVINLNIKNRIIEVIIEETKKNIQTIDDNLNLKKVKSIAVKRANIAESIKGLQSKLDEPTRKFQDYQDKIEDWKRKEKEINGSKQQQNSIKFYDNIIKYLETGLLNEIEKQKKERMKAVKSIFSEKLKIVEVFKSLYKPVTEFISEYSGLMQNYRINLNVSIQLDNFNDTFFNYISRGAKGSFIGANDGVNVLRQITEGVNFNSVKEILSFLNEIIEYLEKDFRNDKKEERKIVNQLKQEIEVTDFYNFLFSLDYLTPTYKLLLGEKNISELSPGERGALLLIFYLLLDKQEKPLIIDQPEENLDNQSVYKILVKFIKIAKKKRQIIIVTHNPNLAVVCDAEQIICVKIEKANKNKFTFISGAIENPEINEKIIEILEGTFPAFDNRTDKYKISKFK
ncbi:MAG: AAA family ATPase [Candidatus Tenebribacter burtonii]|nr:AAA family ATPase [Candidatus Tenebribacter burtonii]